jgi:hypothetical protein
MQNQFIKHVLKALCVEMVHFIVPKYKTVQALICHHTNVIHPISVIHHCIKIFYASVMLQPSIFLK